MSTLDVVQQACAEIEQACDKIEAAFLGTGYVFPRSGIACIINEARRQALSLEHEPPLHPPGE